MSSTSRSFERRLYEVERRHELAISWSVHDVPPPPPSRLDGLDLLRYDWDPPPSYRAPLPHPFVLSALWQPPRGVSPVVPSPPLLDGNALSRGRSWAWTLANYVDQPLQAQRVNSCTGTSSSPPSAPRLAFSMSSSLSPPHSLELLAASRSATAPTRSRSNPSRAQRLDHRHSVSSP